MKMLAITGLVYDCFFQGGLFLRLGEKENTSFLTLTIFVFEGVQFNQQPYMSLFDLSV